MNRFIFITAVVLTCSFGHVYAQNPVVPTMSANPTSIYQEVAEGSTAAITKQITVTNTGSSPGDYNTWNEYDFEPVAGSGVHELSHCGNPYYSGGAYKEPALVELGVKFSKNDLCGKMGTHITKMSYYLPDDVADNSLTFRIYAPSDYSSPGEMLMEFIKTDYVKWDWVEIVLPQPLLIDKSELWLSVSFSQLDWQAPIGTDNEQFKPGINFVKINDDAWIEFPSTHAGNFTLKAESIGTPVPGCWLSLTGNTHGTISGGGNANFNAVLNPTGLSYDAYRAIITMATNDPNNSVIGIPTTLVVLPSPPAPIIYVTPKSINETVYVTGTITKQITVTNYGNAAGTYNATLEGVSDNWISLSGNTTGSVPGGNNNQNFNAVINTTGLNIGTYTATLKVTTSDTKHPVFEIPCTLIFEAATPMISVTPAFIEETFTESGAITKQITVSNSGSATGTYEAWIEGTNNWLTLSGATTGTVPGGSSQSFDAVIDAEELDNETYTATIKISTNDPANPLFEIPCTIVVSKDRIATISIGDRILVYPNPTNGILYITNVETDNYPSLQHNNTPTNIEIFDVFGRTVGANLRVRPEDAQNTLDISYLPAGIYFIKIQTETGTVTKKIIKN
jgi:hypothetical protein